MSDAGQRTQIGDLRFSVFARALHPEWFRTLRHCRIGGEAWEADVRIVDGGHTVSLKFGSSRVTEVLCGARHELPENGLLFQGPVRHERSATLRPATGLSYQTCFEVERVDRTLFEHLTAEMELDAERDGLFARSESSTRIAPPALSHVRLQTVPRGLSLHAFHSFPDESAIVRIVTLFETRVPQPTR